MGEFSLPEIIKRHDSNYSQASYFSNVSQNALRKPTLEETKFLAMPISIHKRDFRSNSSQRGSSCRTRNCTELSANDYSDRFSTNLSAMDSSNKLDVESMSAMSAFSRTSSVCSNEHNSFGYKSKPCLLE